jgi:ATP-dependent Zn protease
VGYVRQSWPHGVWRGGRRGFPRAIGYDPQEHVRATLQKVDAEIRRILDQQYALARRLLEDNRDKVEAMTAALLELETIDADQINDIMAGKAPAPPEAVIRCSAAFR